MNDAHWRRDNGPPPPESALAEHVPDAVMPGRLSAEQEKHWQDCALCRRRVARAQASAILFDDSSDDEFATAVARRLDEGRPIAARLPETVAQSLFGLAASADVETHQVWQLQWRAKACLVAVAALRGWHATVAPVTTDVHLAGSDTVVIDAASSPLQVPTAVWLAAAATVPLATFARKLGTFTQLGGGSLGHALRALRQSGDLGGFAPYGVAGQQAGVDTLELIDVLQTSLAWFASADRALTDALEQPASSRGDNVDVTSLLRGLSRDQLSKAGLTRAELLPALRGEALTDSQAAALAPIIGVEPTDLRGRHAMPEELILEASSPRWFKPRLAFYKANNLTDADGLLALADRALALAARSVTAVRSTDWRSRVGYVLSEYLASPDE